MDSNRYEIGLAIKAVRALTDFSLMAQYRSHTPAILHYMQRYLADFHKYKQVLASAHASEAQKTRKRQALKEYQDVLKEEENVLVRDVNKGLSGAKERLANFRKARPGMLSGKEHELRKDTVNFSFPKMHLVSH